MASFSCGVTLGFKYTDLVKCEDETENYLNLLNQKPHTETSMVQGNIFKTSKVFNLH